MKQILFILIILFYSCTKNNIEGHVYDYDTSKPIRNVQIIVNGNKTQTDSAGYFSTSVNSEKCDLLLRREGYAEKKVSRRQDNAIRYSRSDTIYMYKKDSDFSLKKQ